jgi:hypothetical protein
MASSSNLEEIDLCRRSLNCRSASAFVETEARRVAPGVGPRPGTKGSLLSRLQRGIVTLVSEVALLAHLNAAVLTRGLAAISLKGRASSLGGLTRGRSQSTRRGILTLGSFAYCIGSFDDRAYGLEKDLKECKRTIWLFSS